MPVDVAREPTNYIIMYFLLTNVNIILCIQFTQSLSQLLVLVNEIFWDIYTMNLIFEEAYSGLNIDIGGFCISCCIKCMFCHSLITISLQSYP